MMKMYGLRQGDEDGVVGRAGAEAHEGRGLPGRLGTGSPARCRGAAEPQQDGQQGQERQFTGTSPCLAANLIPWLAELE